MTKSPSHSKLRIVCRVPEPHAQRLARKGNLALRLDGIATKCLQYRPKGFLSDNQLAPRLRRIDTPLAGEQPQKRLYPVV